MDDCDKQLGVRKFDKKKKTKTKKQTLLCVKPRPNDRNMPTQHIATLVGATCCVRLATMLRHVGCCWFKFENSQIGANNTQHVATCRNMSQHGGQTHATCCDQQCCDVLRWHVAIVWPGLKNLLSCYLHKGENKNT